MLASRSSLAPAACSPGMLASRSAFVAEHPASMSRALSARSSLLTVRCVLAPSARDMRPPISLGKPDLRTAARCEVNTRKRVTQLSTSTLSGPYQESQTRTPIPRAKQLDNPPANAHGATICLFTSRVGGCTVGRNLFFGWFCRSWATKTGGWFSGFGPENPLGRVRPPSSWAKESRAQHSDLNFWIGPGERSRHTSVYRYERIASLSSPSSTSRNGFQWPLDI